MELQDNNSNVCYTCSSELVADNCAQCKNTFCADHLKEATCCSRILCKKCHYDKVYVCDFCDEQCCIIQCWNEDPDSYAWTYICARCENYRCPGCYFSQMDENDALPFCYHAQFNGYNGNCNELCKLCRRNCAHCEREFCDNHAGENNHFCAACGSSKISFFRKFRLLLKIMIHYGYRNGRKLISDECVNMIFDFAKPDNVFFDSVKEL